MLDRLSRDSLPDDSLSPSFVESGLDRLMTRHDGLVHAVLRRQYGGSLTYEDRLQAGRIGLWRALLGYDPQRGTTFSTYAWPAIEREVWRAVRQGQGALSPAKSFAGPIPVTLVAESAQDYPGEPEATLLEAELHQTLHTLIGRLPTRLQLVVVAYYGLDEEEPSSLRQLGQRLGLSHEAVRLVLLAALVWLRQPAHSLALRQLMERNTVADYEYADALAQRWLRKRGGRRCQP